MIKVIFFTQTSWAFGNIHNSLGRILYGKKYLCDVLDWSVSRSILDMTHIKNSTDFFVTTPSAVPCLISYGIPYNKIISVAHGEIDILAPLKNKSYDVFEKVYKYAVIGDWLKEKSLHYGITREPEVLHIGIDIDRYVQDIPAKLSTVGFGGSPSVKDYFGNEIKRGDLVKKCCEICGLNFVTNTDNGYIHYTGMPGFYKDVDCVIMASTQETVGLPMMEGAAAGRLVIGTGVGININHSNSIIVPTKESEFIEKTVENLNFYKNNQESFRLKCLEQQSYARIHYRWDNFIEEWVSFLQ